MGCRGRVHDKDLQRAQQVGSAAGLRPQAVQLGQGMVVGQRLGRRAVGHPAHPLPAGNDGALHGAAPARLGQQRAVVPVQGEGTRHGQKALLAGSQAHPPQRRALGRHRPPAQAGTQVGPQAGVGQLAADTGQPQGIAGRQPIDHILEGVELRMRQGAAPG